MTTITPETSRSSRRGRHRAERPTITPLTGVGEAAARTGAIAAVTGGMLASVFSSNAGAAPAAEGTKQTVDYGKAGTGVLADELVDQVQVSRQAETVVEASTIKVTPYAETAAGKAEAKRLAEEKRQAELEAQRQAELEAQRQAEAEAEAAAAEAAAAEAATTVSTTSTGSSIGQQAVNLAMELVGTPYVLGGSTPAEGLDCSGLITYVYGQLGVTDLPRTSSDLRYAGTVVSDPQPGDIVWTSGHVSLYAGNGMIVEAVQPGTPLRYTTMWQSDPTFVRVV
ncbi:C40 family peptidase [Myceligenerans xiligouense]|uniref:Cell wall-associated NlpC family hydrolase n=1 Tax=Myceligenerans xiligouense TaxID=253184 RepID=A0A3N4YPR5_9MICO|nr:C40 family peptidase [Myceligenerans xiligouense]RPF20470.1 cell wall-associated NlpC family hydrolase [Myceligenerans xiligouense]